MRIVGLMILACVLSAGIFGCDKPKPAVGPAAAPGKLRVAMILPGSETDKGWNQMAWEGLERIRKELGAETTLASKAGTSEYASLIRYFADGGYDVIICHGGEFEKPVAAAARQFPKVHFIVGGCPNDIPGAVAVEFLAKDASYLVGVVAANASKSKVAAFVGAQQVPTLQACYDGMRDGLAREAPAVKLLEPQWTNSWDSPTLAKEKTEAVIAAGADVIYQNVDAAAQGVFEAVTAANKPDKPVWAFGCNSNQNGLAPAVILGSVVIDVPKAYLELARDAHDGKLQSGLQRLGLKGGYVDLLLNEQHPQITPAVKEKVAAARKKLVEG